MKGIYVCEDNDISILQTLSLWTIIKQEAFKIHYLLLTLLVAIFYTAFTVYFLNYRFVLDSLLGRYPLQYKFSILLILLQGVFTAFSPLDATLLIVTGILIGINIVFLIITSKRVQNTKLKFFVGGGGLFGLVSAGCASCGFSVLSVLGLGTGFFNILPFGNKSLYMLSIGTLLFSILYMLKKLADGNRCKIPVKTSSI
ncbi:MAG TPA: hypothetical protein VFQ63_00265 [Patescibacteria group bacterium]|nr:hypothetical protein [Patescibacteria group bacterium]